MINAAPQAAAPQNDVKVGQVWLTRGGNTAVIVGDDEYTNWPIRCLVRGEDMYLRAGGRHWSPLVDSEHDLVELLSDASDPEPSAPCAVVALHNATPDQQLAGAA